ncbi:hypothetical protein CSUI_005081 [Cystoisospora suis]|uniref:Uncharacterized protein n=1 Tax=Cystoisospora suis TaxID=483139 RepID=A0A2C6KYB2_9APIC|nr:hypothetical protein CSUI_005081 [Cystoisospora suis]
MILVCTSPPILSSISLDSLTTVLREDVKETKSLDTLLSNVYQALHVQLAQQPDKLRTEDLVGLLERLEERLVHTPYTPSFLAVVHNEIKPQAICGEGGSKSKLSSSLSSSLVSPKSFSFSPSSSLSSDKKRDAFVNSENASILPNRLVTPQSPLLSSAKGTPNSYCFRDGMGDTEGDRSSDEKSSPRDKQENDGNLMTTWGPSKEDKLRAMIEFLLFEVLPSRMDTLSVHLNQRCIDIAKKLQTKFSHHPIASSSANVANEETTTKMKNLEKLLSKLVDSAHHTTTDPRNVTVPFYQPHVSTDRSNFPSEREVVDLEQSENHEESGESSKEMPVKIQDGRRNTTLLPESRRQQVVRQGPQADLMGQREEIVRGLKSAMVVVPETPLGEDKEKRSDGNFITTSHHVGRKRRDFRPKMKKNRHEEENKEEISRCSEGEQHEKPHMNTVSLIHTKERFSSDLLPSSNLILLNLAASHHPSSRRLNLQAPANMEYHLQSYSCSPLSSPSIRCLLSLFVGNDMKKQTIERDQARSTMRATAFLYVRCRRYKKRLQAPLDLLSGLSKLLIKRYEHERQERYHMIRNRLVYTEAEAKGRREEVLLSESPSQVQDMTDVRPLSAQQLTSSLQDSFVLLENEESRKEIRRNALHSSSHEEKNKREQDSHLLPSLLQLEDDKLFPQSEQVSLSPVPLCDLFLHLQKRGEMKKNRKRNLLVNDRLVLDKLSRDEKQGKQPISYSPHDMDPQKTSSSCSSSFSSSSQKDYGAASPLKPSEEEDEEDVQQEREHRQRRGASVSQRMTAEREESLAMNHFIRDQEIRDRDEEERQNSIPDILEKKTCVRSADDIEMKLGEGMNEHILPSYVGPMNIVQELQRLLCLPPERWKSHMASLATLKLLQVLKVCAYQYEGVVSFLEKHQDQLILPPLSSLVVAQEKKEKHRKHSIESPRRTVDLGRRDISASKKEKESSSSSLSLKGSLVPNVDTTAEVSRTRPLDGFNEEGDRVYGAVLAQAILPWGRLDAFLMCLLDVLTSQLHRKYNKSGEDGGVFHRVAASLMEDDRGNKERATAVMRGSPEGMARGNLERLEETEDRDELRGLQSPRGQRQLRSTLRLVTPRDVSLGASILRALAVLQQSHKKFYQGYMERKDFAGSRSSEKDGWIAQEDRERKTPEVGEGVIDEIVFDKEEENRGEEREDMMTRGTDDGRRKTVIDERGEKKKDSGGRRIRVEMKKAYQTRMREEEMARGRSKDDRGMGVLLKSIIHQCAEEVLELLLPSHRLWKLSLLQFVQVVYATEVLFLLSPSSTMKGSFTSLSQSSFPQMDSPSLTGISPSSSLCRTSMLSASIRPDQEKTREDSTPLTDTRGDKLSETGTEHLSSYSTQQASLSPTPSTLTWGKVPMASPFEPCLSYNRREDQPKTLTWGSHSRLLSDLSPSVKRHLFALVAVTESLLHPLPGMKRVNGHRGDRESSSCTFQVSKDQQEGMLCKEPEKQETELGEEHNIQSSVMTMDERCGTAIETSSKAQESTSGAERVETKRKMIKEKKATSKIEGLISFSSLHHSPRRTPLPFTAIAPLTRSFTAMYRHVYLSVEQLRIERKDREPLAKRNAEKKTLRTCEQDHQEEGRELAEGITVDEAATLQRGQDSIRLKTVATAKPSLDEPYIRRRRSFDDRREKEEREIVDKSLRDGEALLEEYEKVLLRLAAEAVCVSHRLSEKHWRTIVRSLLSTVSSSSFLPFFFFSLPLRLRTTEANNERAFSSWSSCHLDNRRDGYHARLSCFSPESSVLNDTLCNTSKRVSPRLSKDLQFLLGYLKRCSHDPRSSTSFSPLKGACTIPAGRTSIDRTRSSLTPSSSSFLRLSSSSSPSSRSSSIPSSPFSAIHPVARFLKETVMLYEEEKRRKSLFLHRASRSSSHADPSPPSMNLSTSSLSYLPAKFSPQMSLDGKEARGRRKQSGERKRLFLTPRSKGGSQQEESLHPVRGVGLYEKNKEISDTEAKGKEKNGEVEESLGRRKKKMKSLFQGYHTEGGSGCSSQTSEEEEERERLPRERKEELLEEDMAAELIQRFMNPMLATEEGTYLPPERVDKPPGERYSLHLYQADANLLGEKTRRGTACEEETPSGEKEMGVKNVDLATPTKGPGSERCF